VTAFVLAPDDARAVFVVADAAGPALCSVTLDGRSSLARLSPPGLAELDPAVALSVRGERVAFRARRAGETVHRLFLAPCDGARLAEPLPLPALPGDLIAFAIDPTAAWALFLYGASRREHLWSVRTDGSAPPLELNQPLGTDREVTDFAFIASPTGPRALFRADVLRNAWYELFSVPLDRSQPPVRLNGDLALHGDVTWFGASPDGASVAYLAEENATDQVELFVRASDGSGVARGVSPTPAAGGDVTRASFSPDGTTLVFLGDLEEDEVFALHAAPADASGPAVELSGPLAAGGDVLDFSWAGRTRVLYRADQDEDGRIALYGVDRTAPGRSERLSGALSDGDVAAGETLAGASLVLYAAGSGGALELFSGPLRTGRSGRGAVPLAPHALAPGLALGLAPALDPAPAWVASPDGAWAFLRARLGDSPALELFLAPTRGAAKPIFVDGAGTGDVAEVRLTRDGSRVVYRGLLDAAGHRGLYLRFFRGS
jgi:hypothetical protein